MTSSRTVDTAVRPHIGLDTHIVMDHALCDLAERRFLRVGDPPTQLHLLASLTAQADVWIGEQMSIARNDGTSWAQIGRLLGISATAARQRWTPATNGRRHPNNRRVPLAD